MNAEMDWLAPAIPNPGSVWHGALALGQKVNIQVVPTGEIEPFGGSGIENVPVPLRDAGE